MLPETSESHNVHERVTELQSRWWLKNHPLTRDEDQFTTKLVDESRPIRAFSIFNPCVVALPSDRYMRFGNPIVGKSDQKRSRILACPGRVPSEQRDQTKLEATTVSNLNL